MFRVAYDNDVFTARLDYEGELGIVIGKSGEKIPKGLALDYIYGYTIMNDVTAR